MLNAWKTQESESAPDASNAADGYSWFQGEQAGKTLSCNYLYAHTHGDKCYTKTCDHKDGHLSTCYSTSTEYKLCDCASTGGSHTGTVALTDVVTFEDKRPSWKTDHPAYSVVYAMYKAAYDKAYGDAKYLKDIAGEFAGYAAVVGKTFCYTVTPGSTPDLCTHTCSELGGSCYKKICPLAEHTHSDSDCYTYTYNWRGYVDADNSGTPDCQEEFTVTWLSEDGKATLGTTKVAYGSLPVWSGETPTKGGDNDCDYAFKAWDKALAPVTGNVSYTATFAPSAYTVKWVDENGALLFSGKVAIGNTPAYSGETPTKAADAQYTYTFSGWTPEVAPVANESVIYTATYSNTPNKYTVTWKNHDGTTLETDENVPYGTMPSYDSAGPSKSSNDPGTSYYFSGWNPEVSAVVGDVTYTAKFDTKAVPSLVFDSQGGSSAATQYFAETGKVSEKPADPTREGYRFAGWYTDNACTTEYVFGNSVTQNTTVYAKWVQQVTVTFDSNGGTSVDSQTLDAGAKATQPVNPTREGYRFDHWCTKDNCSNAGSCADAFKFDGAVTADVAVHAKWVQQRTVTFSYDSTAVDMTGESAVKVDYGDAVSSPDATARDGYTFYGWYTDEACTTEYDFSRLVADDITLYAKCVKNDCLIKVSGDVTYTVNSGAITEAKTDTTVNGKSEVTVVLTPKTGKYINEATLSASGGSRPNDSTDSYSNGSVTIVFTAGVAATYTIEASTNDFFNLTTSDSVNYYNGISAADLRSNILKAVVTVPLDVNPNDLVVEFDNSLFNLTNDWVELSDSTVADFGGVLNNYVALSEKVRFGYAGNGTKYPAVSTDGVTISLSDNRAESQLKAKNASVDAANLNEINYSASDVKGHVFDSVTDKSTGATVADADAKVSVFSITKDLSSVDSVTGIGDYYVVLKFEGNGAYKASFSDPVKFTVNDARPETQVNLLGGKVLAYIAASPITEDRILDEVFAGVSCKGNPDEVIASAHDAVKLTIYSGSDGETPIAASKITEAGTYKAVVEFAGNSQYKESKAEVEFTVSDGRDVTAVVSNGQDFVKLNPMTGDTLTSDAIVEALGIAVNNTTKNTVVPVSEYSVSFSEALDKMKVGGSYTATVSFGGDAAQAPCSKAITFTVVDSRAAVQLDVNATVEVPYGTSNEALLEALLDGKRGIVDSATDAVVTGDLALDIKGGNAAELNVGTYNATVSFAGDNAHQAAEVEVEVAIVKADASVVVDSKTVGYTSAGYNTKDFVSVSPEADHISFAVGLSLGENASSDAGVEAYVNIPSLIDLDSSSIPDSVKSLIKDALKELSDGSTMTVTQLKDALTELSKAIEAANKIGDYFGFTISTESIDTLISILTQIEKIDGIGSLTIRVTMGDDGIAVKNSGVYLAGAVTADPNYNTEAGLGYLFVTPDATRVELAFNFEDENGVVAIQNVIDGTYDFGAHVVKTDGLSDEDLQAASEHLNSLFIGIDENGESVISDSPVASRGAYTQIAYIRDLGNEMYYAKPIARAYVVTTDVAVVEFVDEGGNVVTSGSFTYDGKAHGMKARVSTRGGAAIEAAEVSYKYLGLERGVAFYNSSEPPTAAGVYTVVASYVSEDKTMAGVGAAALTIAPAESSVEVSDLYHVYDGNRVKVASMVSSTPDEAEVALVTAGLDVSGDFSENGMGAVSGVVNIDFPAYADELLKPVCPSAYADGISLDTFVGKLTELKDKLVDLGVSEESIDSLIAMLQSMPNAVTLTFKDQEDVDPTSIGAYLVFACTMAPNYQFSSDLGVLVIGPEITVADLNWNYVDPNGVITSPIVGSVDFGASAFVDGVANDEYAEKIQYLFVGIDDSGKIVTKTDASGLGNGAYTQVAYILDEASADMVCAKPITRAFVVSPQVYGVTFIDGEANPNADQLFVYDGNPHAMEVLVTNPNGDPIGSTLEGDGSLENLTVTYIGIQGDGKGYCSTEPPTAAGVYSVVAVYAVRDAEGTLLYAGAAVGAMAIQPNEAAFEVVDTSVKYDGTEKFPTISNPDGLPYILSVVIDSENSVNVVLPEAWNVTPFVIDDLDDGVAALVAKIEAAASGLQNEDCRAAFEKLAEVLGKVEMKSLSINGKKPVDVGVYQVHAIGFGNSNLVPAYDSGTLEITEADPETIDISGAVIGGFDSTYERTGSAITPDVTVTLDGKVLVKDVDYTVEYSDNVEVGLATITVTGIGNYTGTTSANFWIVSLFDIYGTNVGLYNNIGMNFFVEKTDIVETKSYYAVITKTYADGRDDAVYRIPFEEWESQSKDLCRFGFTGIAAKEMCDVVKVQVFTDDGLPASHEYTDSLRSYAMRLLGKSGNKLLRTTLVDMLNYGASAQIKFNYGTNDLANAQLTSDQKAEASSAVSCADSLVKGERYYGTTVSAESNLVLTFYFTDLDTATHAVVTYTDHYGNNKTFNVDAKDFVVRGDLRGIDVDQLVIADCSQLVTCKVYAGDTLIASASDSVEGYVARAMARQDGSDVYENMLKFAVSARTYFDSLK